MSGFWIDVIDPISGAGGFYTENMPDEEIED